MGEDPHDAADSAGALAGTAAWARRDGHLVIPLTEATVDQVRVDHAITLMLGAPSGTWEIRIESPCTLRSGASEVRVTPDSRDGRFRALDVLHLTVADCRASPEGALHVSFADGHTIDVPFDDAFEAWQVAGPDGTLAVSLPGGELGLWSSGATRLAGDPSQRSEWFTSTQGDG